MLLTFGKTMKPSKHFVRMMCVGVGVAAASMTQGQEVGEEMSVSELAKRMGLAETAEEGSWNDPSATLQATPEAAWMIRQGDIDNFGQTWDVGRGPFHGDEHSALVTPAYTPDLIDGVASTGKLSMRLLRLEESDRFHALADEDKTTFNSRIELPDTDEAPASAVLQFYLVSAGQDVEETDWVVTVNDLPISGLAAVLKNTPMKARQGYLFSWNLPDAIMRLESPWILDIAVDETTRTPFAVDFVKLLLEPQTYRYSADVSGSVRSRGKPLAGISVLVQGIEQQTDANGRFHFPLVAPGLVTMRVKRPDGADYYRTLLLRRGKSIDTEFFF